MRSRFLLAVIGLAIVACVSFATSADPKHDPAALKKQLDLLIADHVGTAQAAVDATQSSYDAGTVSAAELLESHRLLFEAELAAAKSPQATIALHQRNVERTQAFESKVEALWKAGSRGGEQQKLYTARYARQTAEVELLKARINFAKAD